MELAVLEQSGADLAELRALASSDRAALAERLRAFGVTKIGHRAAVTTLLLAPAAAAVAAAAPPPPPKVTCELGSTSGLPPRLRELDASSLVTCCERHTGALPFLTPGGVKAIDPRKRLRIAADFPNLTRIHDEPPLYLCEGFVSDVECDALVRLAEPLLLRSKTDGGVSAVRTSRSCYLSRDISPAPALLHRVAALTSKPTAHMEDPQVARYEEGEFYHSHFDSSGSDAAHGRLDDQGGERVCTVLIYLNEVPRGGGTRLGRLGIQVAPRKGAALIFFPCDVDGNLDAQLLHEALPAVDRKYVCQIWVRQRDLPTAAHGAEAIGLGHRLLDALYNS